MDKNNLNNNIYDNDLSAYANVGTLNGVVCGAQWFVRHLFHRSYAQ